MKKSVFVICGLIINLIVANCGPGQVPEPILTLTSTPIPPTLTSTPLPTPTPWPTPLAPSGALTLNLNFPSLGMENHWVPDPGLAVGENAVIEATNDSVAIYGKDGSLLSWVYLQDLFKPLRQPYEDDAADPRIVYDLESRRFFLITRAKVVDADCQIGECRAQLYIAVSKNDHPTKMTEDDWYIYALDATIDITDEGVIPTQGWPDFTSLGVTKDAVIVSVVMLDRSGGLTEEGEGDEEFLALNDDFSGSSLYSECYERIRIVDKNLLITGGPITTWRDFKIARCGSHQASLNAADSMGESFLVRALSGTPCTFDILRLEGPADAPTMTNVTDLRSWTQDCEHSTTIPQPGWSAQVDAPPLAGGGDVSTHPVYRNGSLWFTKEISQNYNGSVVSAILFLQFDVSNWPRVSQVQSAIISQAENWYFKPAIAVNEQNDVAIVYACTDGQQPISICYSGRLGSDPLNTMRSTVLMKAGVVDESAPGDCHLADRWGDYFGADIDPVDGSAWIVGQYAKGNCWATWIGNLNWNLAP